MLGNKVAYLIFIILTGMFAVFFNNYFTAILFLAITLMPVVLIIILFATASKISVELLPSKNIITKNATEGIILKFTNKSVFPLNRIMIPIQYVNEVTGIKNQKMVELALDQNSIQKICIDLQSNHCGNIKVTINKIVLFDFLHLWKKKMKLSLRTVITVVPHIHEGCLDIVNRVYNKDANFESEKYSKEKRGEDASEVFEIRDYRRGDKPNRIHWKLSQKLDQVMIKEFSDPLKDSFVFILYPFCKENGEPRLALMDGFLESVLTLSNAFLVEEKPHTMFWYNMVSEQYNKTQLKRSEDNYITAAEFLKAPILTESKPIMKDFGQITSTDYNGIFFITTSLSKENLEYLHYYSNLTFCVLIYVNDLDQNSLSQEMKQELYKYQITYFEIHIKNVEQSFLKILEVNLTMAE